jgi:hypothetical protein
MRSSAATQPSWQSDSMRYARSTSSIETPMREASIEPLVDKYKQDCREVSTLNAGMAGGLCVVLRICKEIC